MPEFVTCYQRSFGSTPRGEMSVKFTLIRGQKPGPMLALVSGVHGDEIPSIIGHRLFLEKLVREYKPEDVAGGIISVLFANPLGLEQGRSVACLSDTSGHFNLNRCFPGNSRGTIGERLAHAIFDEITGSMPTCGIDLHCMPPSVPCAIIDRVPMSSSVKAVTWDVASKTGFGVVHDFPAEQYEKSELAGSLSGAMVDVGFPFFTLEVPNVPNSEAAWAVCHALWDVVSERSLSIVLNQRYEYADALRHGSRLRLGIGKYSLLPGPRANVGGLFEPTVCSLQSLGPMDVGHVIREGEVIGEIYDGFGTLAEEIRAPCDCMIAYVINSAPVLSGDELFWLFVLEEN